MKIKSIFLRICILGVLAIFLIAGNADAIECTCSDCVTCTNALNNNGCDTVKLTTNINNQAGDCINNPANFNNKIFDCQGFTIDGDGSGTLLSPTYGIYLRSNQNNIIKNCVITNFYYGICLWNSSNNTLTNNTAEGNGDGILLYSSSNNNLITNNTLNNNTDSGITLWTSSNNTLTNNTANNNRYNGISLGSSSNNTLTNNTANNNIWGIMLASSSNNTLTNNTAKENKYYDIYISADSDAHCNNIIENNIGSGDILIKYFNSTLNLENEILSELILCNADNSYINNVTIKGSDTLKNNGVFVLRTDNSKLTNINSLNNNQGISLLSSSNNNITNNTANSNGDGISLAYSSNNNIANNTANNNDIGIDLYSSLNNALTNNTANNNYVCGILLSFSSSNTLTNNTVKENWWYDIYIHSYSDAHCNNIIENNMGSGDKPIKYFNDTVNLQNKVLSELILCNADNSNINNVTIKGSDTLKNNGVIAIQTDNSNFTNINSLNNNQGIYLQSSSNNTLADNTANTNNYDGIHLEHSSNNTLTNNTANNNEDKGIFLYSSSNNILTNNTANNNSEGIFLWLSSKNIFTNNTANNNNNNGIYISYNSNFNQISNNEISNNTNTGIIIFNCNPWGDCFGGNSNNTMEDNEILNNSIGIFSQQSNSTINSNVVCNNIDLDFDSNNWLSSKGDNNTCNKSDGWNDTGATGCKNKCITTLKTYSVSLNYGWNLISIPITPKNTSIKSVLASVEGKYTKVGAWVNGAGKQYIPDFPFNTLTDIDEKIGFWIKMNQSGVLVVEGYKPVNQSIPLQAGWNLVGYLSANKTLPLTNALASISGKYTKVGAWINGTGKHYIPGFPFNTLINMSEGYGYWIKMNTSGVLEYV